MSPKRSLWVMLSIPITYLAFLLILLMSEALPGGGDLWKECVSASVCDEYEGYYCDSIDWVGGSSHDFNCDKCRTCGGTSALNEGNLGCDDKVTNAQDGYCYDTTGCTSDGTGQQVCACNAAGDCVDTCGDGSCQAWEDTTNCPHDCFVDTTPPSVSIESPLAGSWQNDDFSLGYNATDETEIDQCRLYTKSSSDTDWQDRGSVDCGEGMSVTIEVGVAPGSYCYDQGSDACEAKIRAKDKAGNTNEDTRVFSIDWTIPTTSIAYPPASAWRRSNFGVSISDYDYGGSGLAKCYYEVFSYDGTSWIETKPKTERDCYATVTLTVGTNKNCRHQGYNRCLIRAWARDEAGNTGSKKTRKFSIDWTKPSTSITHPEEGSLQTSDFDATIQDSDAISGLYKCYYRVLSYDGTSWVETKGWTERTCNENVTLTVGSDKDCRHLGIDACKIEAYSKDKAGNQANVASRTFSIGECYQDCDCEPYEYCHQQRVCKDLRDGVTECNYYDYCSAEELENLDACEADLLSPSPTYEYCKLDPDLHTNEEMWEVCKDDFFAEHKFTEC